MDIQVNIMQAQRIAVQHIFGVMLTILPFIKWPLKLQREEKQKMLFDEITLANQVSGQVLRNFKVRKA